MIYFFFVVIPLLIFSSLCFNDTAQSTENNPLPSFYFNYKTFDGFTCYFDTVYLNPEVPVVSINVYNDFFEIFCIFFQISILIKNEKFLEEFIKLFSYKLEDYQIAEILCEDEVDNVQESPDYDDFDNEDFNTLGSVQQDLAQCGSHIIDKVLDRYSHNLRYLSFEKKDNLFFVTCINSPTANPVDSKGVYNEDTSINDTKLSRLPVNLGREISEILLDSKDNLINFFVNELVNGTTEGFANLMLKNTLKGTLTTSKTKRFILKYLRLANDLRKNFTNNPLECIDTIEEILRNAFKDSSKIKFNKGNVSEETIEDLVKKCINLLK
ncbi:hypothetical protein NBO_468g0003 [Nosema bombycis CQ1]|uniref:Uncharacterized protein n=1 Tax=Nosema bombycis (strain CQ1 / CVCC 102059) TaxID=578461 RepID=R0KNN8_NOSB1|nr:hypothetical protein NBO_468g0003 [Nosema bombycis CQ1]|eukprot:EOB12296.1 hypothetical protein NBO_468g0003 [Nosema bombycis CQ1]